MHLFIIILLEVTLTHRRRRLTLTHAVFVKKKIKQRWDFFNINLYILQTNGVSGLALIMKTFYRKISKEPKTKLYRLLYAKISLTNFTVDAKKKNPIKDQLLCKIHFSFFDNLCDIRQIYNIIKQKIKYVHFFLSSAYHFLVRTRIILLFSASSFTCVHA